ncbi:MAG: tetratricopeptide repeat protein [Bdellovibrionia bacterium]
MKHPRSERFSVFSMAFFLSALFSLLMQGCATGKEGSKAMSRTDRARIFVEIANGALVEGDPTAALQAIARAESEDAQLPELHHTRALAYYTKKELELAMQSGLKAVQLKPDYSDAKNTLGKIYLDLGKWDLALPVLSEAATDNLYRDAYKAWTNLGILTYRKNDYSLSSQYFSKAVQNAPSQSCIAHYYLGHISMKEARLQDAIREYSLSTKKFCGSFGDGLLALGVAYQKNKQYSEARKTFIEVQKRFPKTGWAEKALDHLKFLP